MAGKGKKLTVLWTNDNPETAKNMVFMYVTNAMKLGWWDEITVLIWGATAALTVQNEDLHPYIEEMQRVGVYLSACKACAENLGVADELEEMGIEVKYWGIGLTEVLQNNEKLLTV